MIKRPERRQLGIIRGTCGVIRDTVGIVRPGATTNTSPYLPESRDYFARAEALSAGAFALDLVDSYDSDFSAGTDGWGNLEGTIVGNIDGIGGVNDVLRFTCNNTNGQHLIFKTLLTFGRSYEITGEVYIPASNSAVNGFVVADGAFAIRENHYNSPLDSWVSFSAIGTAGASNTLQFYMAQGTSLSFQDAGGDDVIYVRNVRVRNTAYATATESYTKTGIDAFIRSLKGESPAAFTGTSAIVSAAGGSFGTPPAASNVWDKLTELYNLGPVKFGAITAKLKHAGTSTLTNNNFVSGDHVPVGAGGGLKGNGTSKNLKAGITGASFTPNNFSQFVYHTIKASGAFNTSLSLVGGSSTNMGTDSLSTIYTTRISDTTVVRLNYESGVIVATSNGGAHSQFQNGGDKLTGAKPSLAFTGEATLFSVSSNFSYSNAAILVGGAGTGLTDAEADRLSWCINSFATYFGSNTYVNA